jgi:hypothetical protein
MLSMASSVDAYSPDWSRTYDDSIDYVQNDDVPYNIGLQSSGTFVTGWGYEFSYSISYVVSIYQYQNYYDQKTVNVRVGCYVKTDFEEPYDFYPESVTFSVTKDTSGVGLGKQKIYWIDDVDQYDLGFTQSYGLTPLGNPSSATGDEDRSNWAFQLLKVAAEWISEPVNIIINMIDVGESFNPAEHTSYENAYMSASDLYAYYWWTQDPYHSQAGPDGEGTDTYCLNSFQWIMNKDYNPSTFMQLKLECWVSLQMWPHTLHQYFDWNGEVSLGPIYLRINHKSTGGGGGGGGGGGCPYLSVYNGNKYVNETLLDIHNTEDVTLQYTLSTVPAWTRGAYLLRLTEQSQHFSEIDQAKLFAILDNGQRIQLPLIYAMHSDEGNVLYKLLKSDDIRSNIFGQGYNGMATSQYIDLGFSALGTRHMNVQSFVFQIEGHNSKTPW